MKNSLSGQSNPYLQESSEQPVHWMTWGKKVFEMAESLDKPILLSIGYSACYWCNKMSSENYEDPYVASIMNRHFVCVKIDRDDRPDLDQTYMEAIRMFNQSAGWPMHVFCMPDGSPFWGGTFFPKEDSGQGIAPWPLVLMRIAEHFRKARNELQENAAHACANLEHSNHANLADPRDWKNSFLVQAANKLCDIHDDEHGGFTPEPKFPSPMKVDFLLAIGEANSVLQYPALSHRIDLCIQKTLSSIAINAIHDPVGGGFFRYVLDKEWNSPHFEKLLSDNALLVSTYSKAYRKFKNPIFEKVVQVTLDWIEKELKQNSSGYACALSANSAGVEGGYYLWTLEELQKILGDEVADQFLSKIKPIGTIKENSYLPRSIAPNRDLNEDGQQKIFDQLHTERSKRIPPNKDCKCLLRDHALLARALVEAGTSFDCAKWIGMAHDLLTWIEKKWFENRKTTGSVLFPDGRFNEKKFLDDHVFLAEAQITFSSISELYEYEPASKWIARAENLADFVVKHFKDKRLPGYFFTAEDETTPAPVRKKFWYDNALPSGNSSLLRIFHTLSILGQNKKKWSQEYKEALGGYINPCHKTPEAIGHALTAITEAEVGIITLKGKYDYLHDCAKILRDKPYRPTFFIKEKGDTVEINGNLIDLSTASAKRIDHLFSKN